MNILVVEDDIAEASVLTESIKRLGYSVETSATGKDALKKAKQKKFDLVLLDILLPDCKGHKLIPQFKQMWPEIGIVTMTGYNSRELELEVRQQRIVYYMIKPFSLKELKEVLDHNSKKIRKEVKINDRIS
jgi:DNA-binding NtrC family response regulator